LFIADVIEKYSVIDVLVNNAGIGQFNPFPTLSEEEWDAVLDINAKGIFRFSKAVVPNMMENGGGSIVNVTSIMGEFAGIAQSAYNASKGAAKMLTQGMAKDLAECNIRVNAVAPGMVLTGLTRNMFSNDDQRKWFEDKIPMARVGQPEEIAGAIVFLASEDASYITGATLRVDGGMTCATN
jgi:NAD(P)-dependent dehydrogenase (short-subunit alcohol dehydrogenase family)